MLLPALPTRFLYVVSHGMPYSSNGYAVRSHAVAQALCALGHEVIVVSKPGRPWSIEGFDQTRSIPTDQRIDGVRYIFLPLDADPQAPLRTRLRAAERALHDTIEMLRPAAVIAASNWENAEPAQNAARRAAVPFFCEQRGFWDLPRGDGAQDASEQAAVAQRNSAQETRIAQDARACFTLNNAMKAEMVSRGVPAAKIHLMPNAVSAAQPRDPSISRDTLGITARYLIGYVGSLSSYEGLELLIDATAKLRGEEVDVAALLVGSDAPKGLLGGTAETPRTSQLRAHAKHAGIAAHVHMIPQQPYERIGSYTQLLDAFVMPRIASPMTRLVPPIKPYSAAAYGVPLVMTDMPPLDEIAADLGGKLFAEGDVDALSRTVRDVIENTARILFLRRDLEWTHRVQPLSQMLQGVTQSVAAQQATQTAPAAVLSRPAGGFDVARLPQVALKETVGSHRALAYLGAAQDQSDSQPDTGMHITLTRANILAELATREPGTFVIDWLSLRAPQAQEWSGLWSIDDMRLNRLVLDATRIARERGWRCQVIGPVARSAAPLFRTVADVFEEVTP